MVSCRRQYSATGGSANLPRPSLYRTTRTEVFQRTETLQGSDKGAFLCVCLKQTCLTCLVQVTTPCRAGWSSRMQPGFTGWCYVPGKQSLLSCQLADSMPAGRRTAEVLRSTPLSVLGLQPENGSSAMTLRPMPGTPAYWSGALTPGPWQYPSAGDIGMG